MKPARRGGPPRKVENCTGSSAAFAQAAASALPEVKMTPAGRYAVRGKVFLSLEAGDRAVIGGAGTVDLKTVSRDQTRARIVDAWRAVAPAKAVEAYEAVPRKQAVTVKDVRKLALALEGAQEMEAWGVPCFCVPSKRRKGVFARMGPPIGNLLPPDDQDTLYIAIGPEESEALLAMHPERFFVTPHYVGHGVLTRLSENTKQDLPELAELLTEAWRRKAPPEMVQALDARLDAVR